MFHLVYFSIIFICKDCGFLLATTLTLVWLKTHKQVKNMTKNICPFKTPLSV